MQFNEFTRRLDKCQLDVETKFLLSHMFEVQVEFSKAIDSTVNVLESLADKLYKMTLINNGLFEQVKELRKINGVEVFSVRNDSDDR